VLGGTGDSVQCGWEGQTFGADHPDPTRPEGVAQCKRTAGSAEPAASRPRMVIGWGGTTTTHAAQRGWRSANALQAQQSQPRADPVW
jgi:hypothetical protein